MSAKTSNQPGRRTPLSLSGAITKGSQSHNNKGGNSGNNANGHNNNLKQDNKNQQHGKTEQQTNSQKQQQQTTDVKENPTKLQNKQAAASADSKIPKPQHHHNSDNTKSLKQGNQIDKKQQPATEKQQQQNGVSNNNAPSGNQQQENNKGKQQNDTDVKSNEKDNKKSEAKQEKTQNDEKDKNKTQEKTEKDEKKPKNDKKKQELKKDEENKKENIIEIEDKKEKNLKKQELKKDEENKKEDIIEIEDKNSEGDNKTAIATEPESIAKDSENEKEKHVAEPMDVVEDVAPQQQKQDIPKSAPPTPKSAPPTPKSLKESRPATPNKPTPTKTEKTPQKSTPQKSTTTKREVTTCIDDFEMEPLHLESSPSKTEIKEKPVAGLAPCASSTPGKILLPKPLAKTDVQFAMQPSVTPERARAFSQISGRRAIRSTTEYTPSKFQSNPQFRESYRRINTELDATNTSLNVTVGSEIPNNASFSFFGRGRKRERTPPQLSQSAIGELQTAEMEISPPKRARLDFFSVVSSPLSLLRNRFSKATLQSSTPVKLQQKIEENEDDVEVQNVSGVSVHEDIEKSAEQTSECGDSSFESEVSADNISIEGELEILGNGDKELSQKSADKQISDEGDIKITETALQPATGNPTSKNKRCIVM